MLPARLSAIPAVRRILRGRPPAAQLSAGSAARRWNSAQPQPQPPSPHTAFWKEFGRPISKVLLMAVLVYQLAYYGWTKLEQDEIRSERQGKFSLLLPAKWSSANSTAEVDTLEAKAKELQAARKSASVKP